MKIMKKEVNEDRYDDCNGNCFDFGFGYYGNCFGYRYGFDGACNLDFP